MTDLAIQIKPYYIQEIKCNGVSNYDIARSLGASIGHVNRRIRSILSIIPELSPMGIPSTKKGVAVKIYLPTHAAKIVVAKYDNEIGLQYLKFLLECEKVATELTPKLIAQLEQANARIAALERKPIALPRPRAGMVAAPVYNNTLWGVSEIVRYEMRSKETMDEIEILKAKERHLRKLVKGMAAKLDEVVEQMDGKKSCRLIR